MRQITLTIAILIPADNFGHAQITEDKIKIYNLVIERFTGKNLPIINETIPAIDKYDIDGDYNRGFIKGFTKCQMTLQKGTFR